MASFFRSETDARSMPRSEYAMALGNLKRRRAAQVNGFFADATLDMNFVTGAARFRGFGEAPVASAVSITRASSGYAADLAGNWTLFGNNVLRRTNKGLLVEESRTNRALWCRDFTNAAWTKSNTTAAKDQVGIDGASNAASSLTATAANATTLQAITNASTARAMSAWVKRLTGSGVIQMTMDNGATWTAITVTASWSQLSIPTQTLANPTVGFRIVTSGDAIAVDFAQCEDGTFPTSPILTTSGTGTRAADVITVNNPGLIASLTQGTVYFRGIVPAVSIPAGHMACLIAPSTNRYNVRRSVGDPTIALIQATAAGVGQTAASSLTGALTNGASVKAAAAWGPSETVMCVNGASPVASAPTSPTGAISEIRVGTNEAATQQWGDYIQQMAFFSTRLPNASLHALTT